MVAALQRTGRGTSAIGPRRTVSTSTSRDRITVSVLLPLSPLGYGPIQYKPAPDRSAVEWSRGNGRTYRKQPPDHRQDNDGGHGDDDAGSGTLATLLRTGFGEGEGVYQCHALRAETTGFMVGGRRGGLLRTRDRWAGRRCGTGSDGEADDLRAWSCGGAVVRGCSVWALAW